LYGIKKSTETFVLVVTLLAYGCPVQAIVMAFGLDERTVRAWLGKAGQHCQQMHEHFMAQTEMELGQVQADEIKVKTQGGSLWMALAIMVRTRLWLGGVVGAKRDKHLIRQLADQVRQWALCRPILIAVDGFSAYVKAFRRALRTPYNGGRGGRPRMFEWPDVAIVQVVKRRSRPFSIKRRIALGCADLVARLLSASQHGGLINTAYIERLNATFRQRLASLARRTRALARAPQTLVEGMYLVGCVYNFCTLHKSLRLPLYITERRVHWVRRTPAIVAGLTDHCWSLHELLSFKVPLPPYVPPKRRGRPPRSAIMEAIS
jgi:transposase-like protein